MSDFALSQDLIRAAGYETEAAARQALLQDEAVQYVPGLIDVVRSLSESVYVRLHALTRTQYDRKLGHLALGRSLPRLQVVHRSQTNIRIRTPLFEQNPELAFDETLLFSRQQTFGWELETDIPTRYDDQRLTRVGARLGVGKPAVRPGSRHLQINRVAQDSSHTSRATYYAIRPEMDNQYVVASCPAADDAQQQAVADVAVSLYKELQIKKEQDKLTFAGKLGLDPTSDRYEQLTPDHTLYPFKYLKPEDYWRLNDKERQAKIRMQVPSASPHAVERCMTILQMANQALGNTQPKSN